MSYRYAIGYGLALSGVVVIGCLDSSSSDRVERVIDADTIVLAGGERIRLAGIDAPELDQARGTECKESLEAKVEGGVDVERQGKGRHGRTIAILRDKEGTNVNRWLVSVGCAWSYRGSYRVEEREARLAKVGLWSEYAVPPWDWRRGVR